MHTDLKRRARWRGYRGLAGLTQVQASRVARVLYSRYIKIEIGTLDPTPDEKKRIAKALKSTVADLFGHEQVTA